MTRSPRPRYTLPFLLLCSGLFACGDQQAKAERVRLDRAHEDAEFLGQEIFDLVDQTVGYQVSRGRNPRRLRDIGIDSLTPQTARWLSRQRGKARITVAFRRQTGHVLSQCSGTEAVLEELALEGTFRLDCRNVDGTVESIAVGRVN